MNYNQYLYSCLLKVYDKGFEELEYDLQFELLPTLYKEFEESAFNNLNMGEYECIINYLSNKYKK